MRTFGFALGIILSAPCLTLIAIFAVLLALAAGIVRLLPQSQFTEGLADGAVMFVCAAMGAADGFSNRLSEIGREDDGQED